MKIIYIANIRLPTEKAHGIQIMKTCEAFAQTGVMVELIIPNRKNHLKTDPFDYYQVKKSFKIERLFSLDLVFLGAAGFLIQAFTFSLSVLLKYFSSRKNNETFFYTRDEMLAWALSSLGVNIVWETHMGHNNVFIRSLIKRNLPIVAISRGLSDFYHSLGSKNILVSPDGVDLEQFQINDSREEARARLGLPMNAKLVVYTGHLYSWKGADVLAAAATQLASDIMVLFVGGTEKDIELFKDKYGGVKNIMILGSKPHYEIPLYLRAADVLIIPNSANEKISQLYTSPMKLFEYMASGTPIVASDLPSLREILNEENSVLVNPDSPDAMATGIATVLSDTEKSNTLAKQASKDVQKYDWRERAIAIINNIFSHEF